MDIIENLVEELRENEFVQKTRFSGKFVNTVGEIYEKYGYAATRVWLSDKLYDRKTQFEARILLSILEKINNTNIPSSIGGFIIRKIDTLK